MRLWPVDPRLLCRKHLLGEHVETHMMVGSLNRGISMDGFYSRGLIDTRLIRARHDAVGAEMGTRGYQHASPLSPFIDPRRGHLAAGAGADLCRRCVECAELASGGATGHTEATLWAAAPVTSPEPRRATEGHLAIQ